jgi:UDPglucose 6-dehydrogenase
VDIAKQAGCRFAIVETVVEVNEQIKKRMVDKIRKACGGSVDGLTLAVLGLAFKPETDDMRESPAIPIVSQLVQEGAQVRAFDPAAMENAKKLLPPQVHYCQDAYDAATGAHCLVIITEWNQFRSLDLERLKGCMAQPLVVDLRNVYEPDKMREAGFTYHCVGRAASYLPKA